MTYIHFNKYLSAEEKVEIYDTFIKRIYESEYLSSEWRKFLALRKINSNNNKSDKWEAIISMNFTLMYDDQDKRIDVSPKIKEGDIVKIYEYDGIIHDIEKSDLLKTNFWSFLEKFRNINNNNYS